MKILFLDIDGVLNSAKTFAALKKDDVFPIDPHKAFMVGKIQLDTGCEVVLSSAWRHSALGVKEVEKRVVKLLDTTPSSKDGVRGWEIRTWLKQHPEVTRYAILDDDSDMLSEQMPSLFQTTWQIGITPEIVIAVVEYLQTPNTHENP